MMTWPFADVELARRLERTEAEGNARFVESRAAIDPGRGAEWIEVAGAYAMYDGVDSPLTQTFGLGVFADASDDDFDRLERFFRHRDAPVYHEVSPLAAPATLGRLAERGYEPFEYSSVLYRPTDQNAGGAAAAPTAIRVRMAVAEEGPRWAQLAADGWSDTPELAAFMRDLGLVTAARADTLLFFAELGGEPVATGALSISGDVALLAGASTVPRARARGAQNALLEARLQAARNRRCAIAMMAALPGSASQRNAERNGFRIAYTRIKWRLP